MSDEEIKDFINTYNLTDEGVRKLHPMLCEMRDYIMYNKPTSKFYKLCSNENWEKAEYFADNQNKEVLKKIDLFQSFVKKIKTSPEYISKTREEKLNQIL